MIIIYGGAFNPPTKAHYEIIKTTQELFKPEAFLIMPVGNLYKKEQLAPFKNRYEMLEIYKEAFPFLEISKIEENRVFNGTIEILDELSKDKAYENKKISLLIGTDQYLNFDHWIRYKEILEKYELIVITRPHYKLDETKYDSLGANIKFIELNIDVSSTEVRNNLELNKEAVTEKIYDYIVKNNLYRG